MSRQPILKTKHVKWLQKNYNNYPSNKSIAGVLDKMVREDNIQEIQDLKKEIKRAGNCKIILSLESRIATLQGITINERTVQYLASRYKLRKNPKSIAVKNSHNARMAGKAKMDLLVAKAEKIDNITTWIRYTSVGDVKVGELPSPNKIKAFQATLSRWNKEEGQPQGLCVCSEILDRDKGIIKIEGKKAR